MNWRWACLAGDVVINHAPPLALGQHGADDGMETSHCQWFVPSGRQLGIESVELSGRELREAHFSEFGSHDRVGELVVLAHGRRGVADRLTVVQPEVEEGFHGLLPGADLPGRDVGDQLGELTIRESRSGPGLALGGVHHLADLDRCAVRTTPRVTRNLQTPGAISALVPLTPETVVNL